MSRLKRELANIAKAAATSAAIRQAQTQAPKNKGSARDKLADCVPCAAHGYVYQLKQNMRGLRSGKG